MIAYPKVWLQNLRIRRQVADAYDRGCLLADERAAIDQRYPVGFYSPNLFIRVGLFVLTSMISGFSLGFLMFMVYSAGGDASAWLFVLLAIGSYAVLEHMVRKKAHYRSGVDDALLWVTFGCLVSALALAGHLPPLLLALAICVLSAFFVLRFIDAAMTVVCSLSLFGVVFYALLPLGAVAKIVMPFVFMALGGALAVFTMRVRRLSEAVHYRRCLQVARVVGLSMLYASGNYFVVRELGSELTGMPVPDGSKLPLGWLFWLFTTAVPIGFAWLGIVRRDRALIRLALLAAAASVLTVRYYYHVMPVEWAMVAIGSVMIAGAYVLIRYVKDGRSGFSFAPAPDGADAGQLEALAVGQAFGAAPAVHTVGTQFGGGSGGGGGATGTY